MKWWGMKERIKKEFGKGEQRGGKKLITACATLLNEEGKKGKEGLHFCQQWCSKENY